MENNNPLNTAISNHSLKLSVALVYKFKSEQRYLIDENFFKKFPKKGGAIKNLSKIQEPPGA